LVVFHKKKKKKNPLKSYIPDWLKKKNSHSKSYNVNF
jgi:hypothetical protein